MNALPVRLTVEQAWTKWHDDKDAAAREWLVVHYASLIKFVRVVSPPVCPSVSTPVTSSRRECSG